MHLFLQDYSIKDRYPCVLLAPGEKRHFGRTKIANPYRNGVASHGLDVGFRCRSSARWQKLLRSCAGRLSQDGGHGSSRP